MHVYCEVIIYLLHITDKYIYAYKVILSECFVIYYIRDCIILPLSLSLCSALFSTLFLCAVENIPSFLNFNIKAARLQASPSKNLGATHHLLHLDRYFVEMCIFFCSLNSVGFFYWFTSQGIATIHWKRTRRGTERKRMPREDWFSIAKLDFRRRASLAEIELPRARNRRHDRACPRGGEST